MAQCESDKHLAAASLFHNIPESLCRSHIKRFPETNHVVRIFSFIFPSLSLDVYIFVRACVLQIKIAAYRVASVSVCPKPSKCAPVRFVTRILRSDLTNSSRSVSALPKMLLICNLLDTKNLSNHVLGGRFTEGKLMLQLIKKYIISGQ